MIKFTSPQRKCLVCQMASSGLLVPQKSLRLTALCIGGSQPLHKGADGNVSRNANRNEVAPCLPSEPLVTVTLGMLASIGSQRAT